MPPLDEMDRKIIRMLEEDGRKPFMEIAEKLGVSESTVRKRVLALQKEGVIKKFTVKFDPKTLGINTIAIAGLEVEPSKLLEIAQKLCDFSETKTVATSTGDHMIMTEIWAKDGKELAKFLAQIGALEGVKKLCPAIILEKLKE
jgi:Lrp/AsnC family transcriptional regulator for asnA, asnC and gidA